MKTPFKMDRGIGLLTLLALFGLGTFFTAPVPKDPRVKEKLINLNEASLEMLLQIPNLSRKKAVAVLETRQSRGSFASFKELETIKGFGPKSVAHLQRYTFIAANVD